MLNCPTSIRGTSARHPRTDANEWMKFSGKWLNEEEERTRKNPKQHRMLLDLGADDRCYYAFITDILRLITDKRFHQKTWLA